MVFRGIPLEQARQRFDELKGAPPTDSKEAKVVKRRKLKLSTSDKK